LNFFRSSVWSKSHINVGILLFIERRTIHNMRRRWQSVILLISQFFDNRKVWQVRAWLLSEKCDVSEMADFFISRTLRTFTSLDRRFISIAPLNEQDSINQIILIISLQSLQIRRSSICYLNKRQFFATPLPQTRHVCDLTPRCYMPNLKDHNSSSFPKIGLPDNLSEYESLR